MMLFPIQLLEDLMSLLDVLGVWDTEAGHGWTEMIHLGFSILLAFSSQPNLEVGLSFQYYFRTS